MAARHDVAHRLERVGRSQRQARNLELLRFEPLVAHVFQYRALQQQLWITKIVIPWNAYKDALCSSICSVHGASLSGPEDFGLLLLGRKGYVCVTGLYFRPDAGVARVDEVDHDHT